MKKKTLWWIIGGFVVLLIILIAVGKGNSNDATKVAVEKAASHTITETVTASGKIYPETEVKISPEVSGEITELTVEEGDSVRKGQLLVKINPAVYNSIVNQASASVEQSRAGANNSREMMAQAQSQYDLNLATYNRNKKLYQDKVISALEFEQAEAAYKGAKASYDAAKASTAGGGFGVMAAQANLSQAQENLLKTTIVAPTSGIISKLSVKKGERVLGTAQMQGTDMLSIADMSRIEVRVDVSETDIAKVKIGDTSLIEADAYRNRKFKGIVSKVGVSSASATSVTTSTDQVTNYTVHILILPDSYADISANLPKGHFVFKPGMSASVEIQTRREKDILSVPVNAVTTRDWPDSIKNKNKNTVANTTENNDIRQVVFVFDPKTNQVTQKDVKTGIQDNLYIQVTNGLSAGDQVVVAPYGAIARTLKDKTKVKVVEKNKLFDVKKDNP
ncbi:efflux RND transporter periplasmic adaptor subunit [Chitinophagaceae bacterium MMS25-I14]